jgi:hypothetical protein
LVPTSLAASILPESPKRGTRAAGTSEKEVRFGISLCAATPPTSARRRAPDTLAADESPARLSIRFVSLARTAPAARTRWARRQPSAVLQRTHHHHDCRQISLLHALILADAGLIAEITCLVSAYEVRRERSVLAIKACKEGGKPQDIPSDHKTRQGASAEARYDTSNTGVLAR